MIYTLTLNPAVDRELTVPAVEYDAVLRATKSQVDFGGKGFNVSRLLKQMGTESIAVGFLGGKAGEILQEGLQSLGIGADFVWVPGETRTNISIVTPSGGHYIKVNEKGPVISPEKQDELLGKVRALAKSGDWWVLAGSLPPGVPDDFYAQLVEVLNQGGAKVLLDTSGASLHLGCEARPYLVKPNLEEARMLTGMRAETQVELAEAAAEVRRMGAENVILSMGKSGALLQTKEGCWLTTCPKVVEKNPIGAGDSMVGGLVWALTQGRTLKEALAWGVASGSATASLSGTEVGSPALIQSLLEQVQLQPFGTTIRS